MANEALQLQKIKRRLNIEKDNKSQDDLLMDFLTSAKLEIMARRYPYGNYPDELEARYDDLQIKVAVVMYNKQGAEGEQTHNENGVSRSYESYGYLLSEVTPMVGGIR